MNLLILDRYQDERAELYKNIGSFYLLRNRSFYFSDVLSSTAKISKLLEAHWLRVDWQIRRIYRTRNQIVHAGHTPRHINILIKNIHDYLDVVTSSIGRLASDGNKINTIDEAFKYVEIKYYEYKSQLKNNDVSIHEENIERHIPVVQI